MPTKKPATTPAIQAPAAAAPAQPWAEPTTSGIYRRNPQTGELTRADASDSSPANNPAAQATQE